MLPCPTKLLTGYDCPGCGFQRAFFMLLKGDFAGAFHMYAPVYTMILFSLTVLLHFTDKSRSYLNALKVTALLNAVVIVLAYIWKLIH